MTVKITIEYETVEQAILALGKMSGLGKARRAASAPPVAAAPAPAEPDKGEPSGEVPVAAAPRSRKPRADKGQARGAYAPRQQEAGAGDAAIAAPAVSDKVSEAGVSAAATPAAAPASSTALQEPASREVERAAGPASVAGAGAVPSAEEAQKALEAVFEKKGIDVARRVMSEFGVSRLRDLPEAKRAEFIKAAQAEVA